MLGGGTGPAEGTNATTCTPGPWHLERMLQAAEGLPINLAFFGKGNSSETGALVEQINAGACGLKLHEDWGTTPSAIDTCLGVAEDYDIQVAIHTDTLNESGYVENTISAFKGRTIHAFHTEGPGGGHAPDIIKLCGENNVIPSSTNLHVLLRLTLLMSISTCLWCVIILIIGFLKMLHSLRAGFDKKQ